VPVSAEAKAIYERTHPVTQVRDEPLMTVLCPVQLGAEQKDPSSITRWAIRSSSCTGQRTVP
jgi:hypothetical protein